MNVGVGALVRNENNEYLLVKRKNRPEAGLWSIPGGIAQEQEAPHEAIVRELYEETGSPAYVTNYIGSFVYRVQADNHESVAVIFEAALTEGAWNAEPAEHFEIAWFSRERMPEHLAMPAAYAFARLDSGIVPVTLGAVASDVDVVLVAPFFPLADKEALSIPLGLANIHSYLDFNGFSVKSFDCSIALDYANFIGQIDDYSPKIVGVQFHSDMSWSWAVRTCYFIRRKLPTALVVAGGELATSKAEELVSSGCADVAVCGEGEVALFELAAAHLRKLSSLNSIPGLVVRGSNGAERTESRPVIDDIDMLPMPAVEAFRWREYGQWSIFTSRGCPFQCTYCSSAAFWKHSVRYHSPRRVLAEIRRLVEQYGARDIYIADDTFTLDRKRVVTICQGLREQRLGIRWSCLTRVDLVDQELLEEMKASGCCLISFGVETGNDSTLRSVKKASTFAIAERALGLCREVGIRSRVSIIIGLPGESPSDVLRTLAFLRKAKPNEVQVYGLTPHDGTVLYGALAEWGVRIIEPDLDKWSRNVLSPVCETDQLSSSEIIRLGERFFRDLQQDGYTYLTEDMDKRKLGLDRTVATAFAPVQVIGGVTAE